MGNAVNAVEDQDTSHLPDPDLSGLKLPGWGIIARQVAYKEKTDSGLYLAPKFNEDAKYLNYVAKVLKVGDMAYNDKEVWGEPWCKEGDYVVFPRLAAERFEYDGIPLVLLGEKAVLFTVDDPSKINVKFGL